MATDTTILIIDDNISQQARLEEILDPLPNPILRTNTIDKAFDIMRYTEVSVILLAQSFNLDTNHEFMDRLFKDPNLNDSHVIIVLDKHDKKSNISANYKSGAVDYIEKPFAPETVRSMVGVFDRLYNKNKRVKELLLNILPKEIAQELEMKGKVKPKRYQMVSIMFADFVSFSRRSKEMSPVELLNLLDQYFARFDKITSSYQLEKIKTIGDAYMCAGGVPEKNKENAIHAVLAAIEINQVMERMAKMNRKTGKKPWLLRVGIHTGPIVAGVIGKRKFAFDIWGDSVNVASRICSASEPNRVNISQATYEKIKPYFECEYRGEIEGKNIGHVGMYYVNRILPKYSANAKGTSPTVELKQLAGLVFIQYNRLRKHILNRLEKELPKNLYYHGPHHTLDVLSSVSMLGGEENLSSAEQLLLNTAALLHDCGYLYTYHHNEELAVKMAKKILPDFGYSATQIRIITGIIRTTKVRSIPKTKLQKIMNDADYDYLGRKDYTSIAESLLKELKEQGLKYSKEEWLQMQIKFLERHKFYTETSRQLRDEAKAKLTAKLRLELIKIKNGK